MVSKWKRKEKFILCDSIHFKLIFNRIYSIVYDERRFEKIKIRTRKKSKEIR